jgi:hypothetical protein
MISVTGLCHGGAMAEVLFLPHYAEVLESVVLAAQRRGAVDVECDPALDQVVIAGQIDWYARTTGRRLRCRADGDHVMVRSRR